jgi:hypothetical protein
MASVPLRPTRPALLGVGALLLCAVALAPARAERADTAEIHLQRGADGRAVLTDRPRAGVAVERTGRVARADPVAARERADRVARDAAATSARVQRTIDAQQDRLALAERQRARAQADEAERLRREELRAEAERPVVVAPWLFPGTPRWQPPPGARPPPPRTGPRPLPHEAARRPAPVEDRVLR